MTSDCESIEAILESIGTDTLPYVPPKTAALLKDADRGQERELLERLLEALLEGLVAADLEVGR
jgi:hypothetical protein